MVSEAVLTNAVMAWAEESLDGFPAFRGAKIISAFQENPVPEGLFVTADLTNDEALSPYPLFCETISDPDCVMRERTVLREATFSLSAYRSCAYDAAKAMIATLDDKALMAELFGRHRLSVNRWTGIARLNDVVNEQWEKRAQFTIYLRYAETACETDAVMTSPCIDTAPCATECP